MDDGWGAYDVLSDSGLKIEVKTSGYIQTWKQSKPSAISFSGLITQRWNAKSGYTRAPSVVADVYVFVVQTCIIPEHYDPLDIDAWDFYVIPGSKIREVNQKSMRLSTVKRLAGNSVHWDNLRSAIVAADDRQH